jgi:D-alanyl-D-alanine carboxypeptidase (penicillin-binding protein 5/6)
LINRFGATKAVLALAIAAMIVMSCASALATPEQRVAGAPDVPQDDLDHFPSMSVVDVTCGVTMFERGEADSLSPSGSAVTLMTAYIIAQDTDMAETITVSADLSMLAQDARRLGIASGESWKVSDLVAAMTLYGAQDAAVILAQYAADSMSAFVEEMNARAAQLGMTNTRYANAYGAYDAQQTTTTHDLMTLAEAVAKNETLRGILAQASYTPEGKSRIDNRLRLMQEGTEQYDARVTGMGAGTTTQSGTNMIILATANGRELLLTLHSPSTDSATAEGEVTALLDHFFDGYSLADVTRQAAALALQTPLTLADGEIVVTTPKGDIYVLAGVEAVQDIEADEDAYSLRVDAVVESRVEPGEWVATAMLLYEGTPVAQVELVAVAAEEQAVVAPVADVSQDDTVQPSASPTHEIPFYTSADWQPEAKVTLWEKYDWLIIIAAAAVLGLGVVLLAIPTKKMLR